MRDQSQLYTTHLPFSNHFLARGKHWPSRSFPGTERSLQDTKLGELLPLFSRFLMGKNGGFAKHAGHFGEFSDGNRWKGKS